MARGRTRRRNETLWEHGGERPCSEALIGRRRRRRRLLPPPPPPPLLVADFFFQEEWWGVLDVEQLVGSGGGRHSRRSGGLDFVGRS